MDKAVGALFARYEAYTAQALTTAPPTSGPAELYAADFIAASPLGVRAGHNDPSFAASLAEGFEFYRTIGTRAMTIRDLRITPIDDLHCIAHVGWSAVYERGDLPRTSLDFEVRYLVQVIDHAAKVFGWISGDEQALLKKRGII